MKEMNLKADIASRAAQIAVGELKQKLRDTGKYEILLPKPEPAVATVPPSVVTPAVRATPTVETKPVAAPKP